MAKRKQSIDYTKIIKTVDPLIQTILFISFFYMFDMKGHREHFAILTLVKVQWLSFGVNLFLRFKKKLKLERYLSVISITIWYFTYRFMSLRLTGASMREIGINTITGTGLTQIPVYETAFMVIGLTLSAWYFSICIREIQYLYKKKRKN